MCPTEAQAHEIYTLLRENWTYYQSVLPHIEEKLWIDHCVPDWIGTEDYYIEMRSGGYGIYYEHTEKNYHRHRYLLQITKDSDWLVKEPQGIYTIIAASGKGSGKGNYSAANLFDNNTNTKWTPAHKADGSEGGDNCYYVEVMTAEPINPTAYYMTTCNYTKMNYSSPNSKIWNIYAKKNMGDAWALIDKRDNTDIQKDSMAFENSWTGWWDISVGKEMYQYFRLEMYENWGADCFQISELGFYF